MTQDAHARPTMTYISLVMGAYVYTLDACVWHAIRNKIRTALERTRRISGTSYSTVQDGLNQESQGRPTVLSRTA